MVLFTCLLAPVHHVVVILPPPSLCNSHPSRSDALLRHTTRAGGNPTPIRANLQRSTPGIGSSFSLFGWNCFLTCFVPYTSNSSRLCCKASPAQQSLSRFACAVVGGWAVHRPPTLKVVSHAAPAWTPISLPETDRRTACVCATTAAHHTHCRFCLTAPHLHHLLPQTPPPPSPGPRLTTLTSSPPRLHDEAAEVLLRHPSSGMSAPTIPRIADLGVTLTGLTSFAENWPFQV